MEKELILEGELVKHQVTATYTQGHYDSEWNNTGSHEQDQTIDVVGLKQPSGNVVVLAEVIYNLFQDLRWKCERNKGLSAHVSYSITNKLMSESQITENMLKVLYGAADADYGHHFSDLTGYLWTDEKFVVNKHDVVSEIVSVLHDGKSSYRAHMPYDYEGGKFLFLKVVFTDNMDEYLANKIEEEEKKTEKAIKKRNRLKEVE